MTATEIVAWHWYDAPETTGEYLNRLIRRQKTRAARRAPSSSTQKEKEQSTDESDFDLDAWEELSDEEFGRVLDSTTGK